MKYCPHCGYSPIKDDATVCPCCGEDVAEQVPCDYPQEDPAGEAVTDSQAQTPKTRKRWKDQPLKLRLALVISGFVIVVGACITILCLF